MIFWFILVILFISWRCKKQSTVSRSSTESEYRALDSLTCEIIWVVQVVFDLKFSNMALVNMFCDNDSAVKLALNPVFHDKTKHFKIDIHFIREKIANGVVSLVKVSFVNQIADILTKSLSSYQHDILCGKMCLIDPFFVKQHVK